MRWFGKPVELSELHARARREMFSNPSITSYVMVDGYELRTAVSPLGEVKRALNFVFDSITNLLFGGMDDVMAEFTKTLDTILEAFAGFTEDEQ